MRAVITGGRALWALVKPTPEVAARAAISAVLTRELRRVRAQASDERAGYVIDEHGERVLSVRPHETCDHASDKWEKKNVGMCGARCARDSCIRVHELPSKGRPEW